MANLGQSQGGLSKASGGGNYWGQFSVHWLVLLKFRGKIWQDKSNGQVAEGEDAKTMWAEGNKGGQSCLLLIAKLLGTKDLAGFQKNSSLVSQPRINHSTNKCMGHLIWVSTSTPRTSNVLIVWVPLIYSVSLRCKCAFFEVPTKWKFWSDLSEGAECQSKQLQGIRLLLVMDHTLSSKDLHKRTYCWGSRQMIYRERAIKKLAALAYRRLSQFRGIIQSEAGKLE